MKHVLVFLRLTYEVCPEKVQPVLIEPERFARHRCDLAAKASGLECTRVNNGTFTVLVSGGGRRCLVSLCTVWLSHSKWLSEQSYESASNFALSLNILLWKVVGWFRRPQLWVAGGRQLHHCNVPAHASRLVQSFLAKHQIIATLQPRFVALRLLAFPRTKITFERREISDHPWYSGKYDRAADGDWENCVRSQGADSEGD